METFSVHIMSSHPPVSRYILMWVPSIQPITSGKPAMAWNCLVSFSCLSTGIKKTFIRAQSASATLRTVLQHGRIMNLNCVLHVPQLQSTTRHRILVDTRERTVQVAIVLDVFSQHISDFHYYPMDVSNLSRKTCWRGWGRSLN